MPLPEFDAAVGHSFALSMGDVQINQIQEVSGLKIEQDVIEMKYQTKEGKYGIKKLPGRWKAGELTLTRGLTADNSFEKWVADAQLGKMGPARKNGQVMVMDFEGAVVKTYKLTGCWPKSLEIGALKAGDTSVLTEKLVITFEKIEAST